VVWPSRPWSGPPDRGLVQKLIFRFQISIFQFIFFSSKTPYVSAPDRGQTGLVGLVPGPVGLVLGPVGLVGLVLGLVFGF